jgi:hypothetical protein
MSEYAIGAGLFAVIAAVVAVELWIDRRDGWRR